ncbi:HAMP domain-containing protein [Micromonospora cremea]|uniref:HAMP domain-containing protein n=1 Tax=Micromonospora cremea TaxID=709881 RepID=A0A1N5VWG5_9ACTN|nr:HAMP domain-containing protein [Micromonospora cremea]SIM77308.1 HAMP domain-containing protein [Micromonospora cremea]
MTSENRGDESAPDQSTGRGRFSGRAPVAGPTPPPEQVVPWRRRALDQQLPAAGFPAGSNKPSLVYIWATMVLAAAIVLGFAVNNQRGVPPAVVESQRDNVAKVASSMRLTINHSVEDLDQRIAGRSPTTPDPELLKQVVANGTEWTGATIVETATRRPLATAGSGVPLELLPPALPAKDTFPITTPNGPALVRSLALDGSKTLLATQPLDMDELRLNPKARQGVFVITPDGKSTLMQGVSAVPEVHLPVAFQGLAASTSNEGHPIRVTEWVNRQLVVSSAPVGDTGATVATLIVADETGGTSTVQGFVLGLTLLALAVPSFLLMRMSLVGPVRSLLKQAKDNACGAVPTKRYPLRVAEAHRIARALALTSGDRSPPAAPRWRWRWRPTVVQGMAAATVVALLWPAAAVAYTLREPEAALPDQLVSDEESKAEGASTVLGKILNNGLQTVTRTSQAAEATDPSQMTPALEQELADKNRFRAFYLMDPSGSVLSSAGREPLRKEPLRGETGIDLDGETSRVPVVYAFRVADNGVATVGEFDIDYLLDVLRSVDGQARIVDEDLRTVFDSEGFRAFEALQGNARVAASEALKGGTVGMAETPDGEPALVAAAGLNKPNTVAPLKWSIVVEQDLAGLRLPESDGRRWTLLVAGAVTGIVLLTQMWQYYVFARPLRRLATAADRISDGSVEEPISPQRHDDIGALAMCLEICRQVRHTGSDRLGGASRLRGTEDDRTVVLPEVPQSGADAPAPPATGRADDQTDDREGRG